MAHTKLGRVPCWGLGCKAPLKPDVGRAALYKSNLYLYLYTLNAFMQHVHWTYTTYMLNICNVYTDYIQCIHWTYTRYIYSTYTLNIHAMYTFSIYTECICWKGNHYMYWISFTLLANQRPWDLFYVTQCLYAMSCEKNSKWQSYKMQMSVFGW